MSEDEKERVEAEPCVYSDRVLLLREMWKDARNPHDPEKGIYANDYPFAKLGIERMRRADPADRFGSHFSRLEEIRKRSRASNADGTSPTFGGEFHQAMAAGFDYAVMLFDEWISMIDGSIAKPNPTCSKGPDDGSCTG
jgi:hypothetical protein